eukprot:2189893-Pleurochrysis_carterae.AAC.1
MLAAAACFLLTRQCARAAAARYDSTWDPRPQPASACMRGGGVRQEITEGVSESDEAERERAEITEGAAPSTTVQGCLKGICSCACERGWVRATERENRAGDKAVRAQSRD